MTCVSAFAWVCLRAPPFEPAAPSHTHTIHGHAHSTHQDYGTMSAGAVWTLLGIYPLAGTEYYVLGSPSFANVTVRGGGAHSARHQQQRRRQCVRGAGQAQWCAPVRALCAARGLAAPARHSRVHHDRHASAVDVRAAPVSLGGLYSFTHYYTQPFTVSRSHLASISASSLTCALGAQVAPR